MKKQQIYGIVSIVMGALLVIPTFLAFVSVAGVGVTFFDMIKDIANMNGAPGMVIITIILSIVTLVAAAALIIVGILLFFKKIEKVSMITLITSGIIAIATGIFAIIAKGEFGAGFNVGIGTIFYLILGVLTVAAPFVLKLLLKDKE